jgi:rRNA maturation RNase YbeY
MEVKSAMGNNIHIENTGDYDLPAEKIENMVNWILKTQGQNLPWAMTFVFVSNEFIIEQNKQYFDKSTPTDVISFNLSDSDDEPEGEVYISVDMAATNAGAYDVTLDNELLRLVAHGTYHVLGFTDSTEEKRQHMTALENAALDYIYLESKS